MHYTGIGSRETPDDILELMTAIARRMAADRHILRSGAADGADSAFERGTAGVVGSKEIYLPWLRFNNHASKLLPTPEAFVMAAQFHPAWHKCRRGAQALHARNCHQVLGHNLKTPSSLVICWTKDAAGGGGTGQAIRIAKANGITVHDLCDHEIRKLYET